MPSEKQVSYPTTNTYSILNDFTPKTRNIWISCHGIGYLSEFFIAHFKHLDPETNYIIAPQAPSKYYQDKSYKYIGASWFTRKYLDQEIKNVCNYLDAVYEKEVRPLHDNSVNLILFGYSQGVSAITRWVAYSKINCAKLLLHSGGIPDELVPNDFTHLNKCKISLTYGDQDEYLNRNRLIKEEQKCRSLWGKDFSISNFEGTHEVNEMFIKENA